MRTDWPPPIWLLGEKPVNRWIGRFGGLWIAAVGTAFFLFLILVGGLLLGNGAAVTVGLLVGAVTVASSFVYTMAYRLVDRDTMTLSRLLLAFGLGGLIAVALGSTFDSGVLRLTGGGSAPTLTVLALAGITEELAKIIAVVAVSYRLADKSVRNGLFLGGAVGLGFAALEDLAYAVNFYQNPPEQLHLTPILSALLLVPTRGILTPFLHPLYTALFAAALFAASENGRFRIRWVAIVGYLGVSFAHGLWDFSAGLLQDVPTRVQFVLAPLVVFVIYPGIIVGTGLLWIRVARRARHAFHVRVLWWLAAPPAGGPAVLPPDPAPPTTWAPPVPHTRA